MKVQVGYGRIETTAPFISQELSSSYAAALMLRALNAYIEWVPYAESHS